LSRSVQPDPLWLLRCNSRARMVLRQVAISLPSLALAAAHYAFG
jgi:hypothetical protein